MLGTNDSKPWNWDEHGSEYQADLAAMVDTFSAIDNPNSTYSSHPRILLCLPPPATESNGPSIRGSIIENEIIPKIRAVAQSRGDSIIDAHTPLLARMDLLSDGVHPGVEGAKVLGDLFHESIYNLALNRSPQTRWLWYGSAPGALANNEADKPMLFAYPAPESIRNGVAVIICPGGGYSGLSMDYEGHDVARWFNNYGVTAFVLRYRYSPYRHPIELNDAKRAMRIVRYNAAAYGIDTTRIGIMGFSAGGHLASTLGTHYDTGDISSLDPIDRLKSRPDFMALIYPVITLSGSYAHTGSRDNLLGTAPSTALVDSLSNQKWVTPQTPQTFLAIGDADNTVPIQNSRMFDSALVANGVSEELLVEPGKDHGYGMNGNWPTALITWMKARGIIPKPVDINNRHAVLTNSTAQFRVTVQPNKSVRIILNSTAAHHIEIYDFNGRRLSYFGKAGKATYTWQPPSQGVYIVHAVVDGKVYSQKVVFQK
jgi:acetyl esterase/lipase